ncbi:hypothetical protein [Bacillus sp. BS98]|uniref:hypothetical protein n=1 Tax=Bacillus sp. BS98 TaxID=2608254 RepID=UPI00122FA84D|nr:hypothetical protein [Bacillus sp. BS98]QEQ20779.1 hypothetical protein F0362_30040 [Bacillus sp. BS98]
MVKTTEEQLKELQEQEKLLKEKKRELMRKAKEEAKEMREKELKDTGLLCEEHFGIEQLSLEDRKTLFSYVSNLVKQEMKTLFKEDDAIEEKPTTEINSLPEKVGV